MDKKYRIRERCEDGDHRWWVDITDILLDYFGGGIGIQKIEEEALSYNTESIVKNSVEEYLKLKKDIWQSSGKAWLNDLLITYDDNKQILLHSGEQICIEKYNEI